jgi:hypothetical protein
VKDKEEDHNGNEDIEESIADCVNDDVQQQATGTE